MRSGSSATRPVSLPERFARAPLRRRFRGGNACCDYGAKVARMDDESTRRILDGTSWEEFCDTLKAAGAVVLDESSPESAFDRAEGFRYLSRLTRAALETFVEDADPRAPVLQRTVHETVKMGADNPDNHYQSAPISGKYEYRITGTRGTVHYLGFGTQAGNYGATGSLETTGYLDDSQLQLEPDGSFEILVSCRERPGAGTGCRCGREPNADRPPDLPRPRSETLAELRIERIDGPHQPRPVSPVADRSRSHRLRTLRGRLRRLFPQWAAGFAKHVNQLPRFDAGVATAAGGDPNIAYYHGYWKLAPGRGAGHRGDASRVRLLELPAQQSLDGVARLPLLPDLREQAAAPGYGRTARCASSSPTGIPAWTTGSTPAGTIAAPCAGVGFARRSTRSRGRA